MAMVNPQSPILTVRTSGRIAEFRPPQNGRSADAPPRASTDQRAAYDAPAFSPEHIMSNDFGGKRVVITGGSGALGSAVVELLAAAGALCEVTWVNESEQKHQTARDRVRYTRVDVTDERAV